MAPNSHRVVRKQTWSSRIGGSIKGIVFGITLLGGSFLLLFWNEGRAVSRHKALQEGSGLVVSISSESVDPVNEGKLVHITGLATTTEILEDEAFGVAVNAIHLERSVEMYQWKEDSKTKTEKKVGGGTETITSYSYTQTWADRIIDSSNFQDPSGHQNPDAFPYSSRKSSATTVSLGAFQLSTSLVRSINHYEPLEVDASNRLSGDLRWRARPVDGAYYVGRNPRFPEVGDLKVRFRIVRPAVISIVAQQAMNGFRPFTTSNGETVQMLHYGTKGAAAMFASAVTGNRILTWFLRGLGLFLMFFGLRTVFKPLSVAADVLPFLGNLASSGVGFISFFLALILSSLTIAVAWLFYRPMIALTMVLVAVAAFWLIRGRIKKSGKSGATPTPPPAPVGPPTV